MHEFRNGTERVSSIIFTQTTPADCLQLCVVHARHTHKCRHAINSFMKYLFIIQVMVVICRHYDADDTDDHADDDGDGCRQCNHGGTVTPNGEEQDGWMVNFEQF